MKTRFLALATTLLLTTFAGVACNNKNEGIANQKQIEVQLKLAGLNNVNIHLDKDRKVARIDGTVKTNGEKAQAERIVSETAPSYVVANEIEVRTENASTEAAKVDSNQDGAINSDWRALEAKNDWDNQDVRTDVKNGVVTLKGDVATMQLRTEMVNVAAQIPNVKHVVNELEVKSAKAKKKIPTETASE